MTGKKEGYTDKFIFLPDAFFRNYAYFDSDDMCSNGYSRYIGLSIRPVYDDKNDKIKKNMKTAREKIAVMQAYVDGKTIQCTNNNHTRAWTDISIPNWEWDDFDYHVKPEKTIRKYNTAEEVLEAIKSHGHYIKDGATYRILENSRL